jgi:DNA replication protein DnaC
LTSLRSIGVRVSRDALLALIAHPRPRRLSPEQPSRARRLRRAASAITQLAARPNATIGSFKPSIASTGTTRAPSSPRLSEELCTLELRRHGHNVLLRGPSGVGKTMLA